MGDVLSVLLDVLMIGLLVAGIRYAMRIERQMAALRASRTEMERFVMDFNATVTRAEAGIQGMKRVARESGDDLEKLLEKAQSMRDELHFLVEHGNHLADRLTDSSTKARQNLAEKAVERTADEASRPVPGEESVQTVAPLKATDSRKNETAQKQRHDDAGVRSRAERDLLQAIEKLR